MSVLAEILVQLAKSGRLMVWLASLQLALAQILKSMILWLLHAETRTRAIAQPWEQVKSTLRLKMIVLLEPMPAGESPSMTESTNADLK